MIQDRLEPGVRALVSRLRRQRPLRSGSLLITILGDSIVPRGGAVTLGSLIKLTQPLDLPERLVRTSVGRLAKEGWLSCRRIGRQSEYTLTLHGRERFAEATERIYGEPPKDWDRTWTLLLLPSIQGHVRDRIRREMLWLGFGQLEPGLLAHPSRDAADTRRLLKEMGINDPVIVLRAASGGLEQDHQLIAAGWNLKELARSYRRFIETFATVQQALAKDGEASPEQAFVIRTLLIHEYRKIHLRDPLLPWDLLPSDWVGTEAYAVCGELYRRIGSAADEYVSARAHRLESPLGPVSRGYKRRFAL
jgi:phenylacetic acid degradation operon negative regulatory protein